VQELAKRRLALIPADLTQKDFLMRLPRIAAPAALAAVALAVVAGSATATASAPDPSTASSATSVAGHAHHHYYEPAVMNASPSRVAPGAKITFDGSAATLDGKPLGNITKIVSDGFAGDSHKAHIIRNKPHDFTATATVNRTPGVYSAYLYTSDHPSRVAATATFKVVGSNTHSATITVHPRAAANGQTVIITGNLPTNASGETITQNYSVGSDAFIGHGADSVTVNPNQGTYAATATVGNTPGEGYTVSLYGNGKRLVSTPFSIVLLSGSTTGQAPVPPLSQSDS
jgi:hypothetical protein